MKPGIMKAIDREIEKGSQGRIIIKANAVTERELIDKLMEASCAGVRIDLIIRGICCLIPGIPGKTENIIVTSIVGRFLEHSRIYSRGIILCRKPLPAIFSVKGLFCIKRTIWKYSLEIMNFFWPICSSQAHLD